MLVHNLLAVLIACNRRDFFDLTMAFIHFFNPGQTTHDAFEIPLLG